MNSKTKIIIVGGIVVFLLGISFSYFLIKRSNVSFSGIVGSTFSSVPTQKYTIQTPGINPRVYEWDTKSGYHCIALFRDDAKTSPSMQCFKK